MKIIGECVVLRREVCGLLAASAFTVAGVFPASAIGTDGTWTGATNSDFTVGTNWTSTPFVPSGTGTFAGASPTSITFGDTVSLQTLQFNAGAPAYTFTLSSFQSLGLTGSGIIDNSSHAPTFNLVGGASAATLNFSGSASAGDAIINATTGGKAVFTGNSTGGTAAFTVDATSTIDFSGSTGPLGDKKLTAGSLAGGGSVLIGANTLSVGGNNSSTTFSGVISGTGGSLVKVGTGTFILTGSNTYSGPTTISAGTLQLGNGGTTGGLSSSSVTVASGATFAFDFGPGTAGIGNVSGGGNFLQLGSETTLVFAAMTNSGTTTIAGGTFKAGLANSFSASSAFTVASGASLDLAGFGNAIGSLAGAGTVTNSGAALPATLTAGGDNTSTTFSGVIQDGTSATSFTKTGTGMLTLNGINTYTGLTTVSAGTLAIGDADHPTASIAGPVTVSPGAQLIGHGSAGALTNTSGTVTPGGSIGTLTVSSYTQGPGGTLNVEVSPTVASQLKVTGAASIDGTLGLVFDPGVYTTKTYTIVSAASVTGTFATVTGSAPAGTSYGVAYTPTEVDLTVTQLIVAPTNDTVFTALTSADVEAEQSANRMLLGRLGDRRTSRGAGGGTDALFSDIDLWMRGGLNILSADASATAPDFSGQTMGFLAGADWSMGVPFILGVEAGYSRDNVSESTGSNGGVNAFRLGAYGSYTDGPLSVDGTFGISFNHYDAHRPVTTGTAASTHNGYDIAAGLRAGYAVPLDEGITLTPNAGLDFAHLSENSIAETGAGGFDLTAGGRVTNSVRPFIGLEAARPFQTDDGTDIAPQIHLSFSSEVDDATRNMTVTTASGFNFAVTGVAPSRDQLGVGAGVTVQTRDDLAFHGNYDALIFGNAIVHTVSAELQYRF